MSPALGGGRDRRSTAAEHDAERPGRAAREDLAALQPGRHRWNGPARAPAGVSAGS
jgi:hypothetical protein